MLNKIFLTTVALVATASAALAFHNNMRVVRLENARIRAVAQVAHEARVDEERTAAKACERRLIRCGSSTTKFGYANSKYNASAPTRESMTLAELKARIARSQEQEQARYDEWLKRNGLVK